MKKLAFHNSLRWKMIILPILTTSPVHFCFQGLGECNFLNLGVKGLTHLSGLRSMQTCWCTCWRKDGGLSWTTCCILSRVWKCAIKKFSVSIIMWDDRAPIETKMHIKELAKPFKMWLAGLIGTRIDLILVHNQRVVCWRWKDKSKPGLLAIRIGETCIIHTHTSLAT